MNNWKRRLGILVLVMGVGLGATLTCGAQSLAQTIEQLMLDYQKLSEYKQILSDMYTAYTEIKKGYEQIKNIAAGNYSLHEAFLDALLEISPVVRNYVKITTIINNEAQLVKEYKSATGFWNKSGHFSAAELDAINSIYSALLNGSLRNLDELAMIMTAGTLRMNDAERLAAIDRIDKDMTDRLAFLRVFNNQAAIQAGQRGIDENNFSALKRIYGKF